MKLENVHGLFTRMTMLTTQIATAFGICISLAWHAPGTKTAASSAGCPITSKVIGWSIDRIRTSPAVKTRELTCKQIGALQSANPDSLEITTGRISGKPVICISPSRSQPCQYILADLPEEADPTSMLAEIFNYRQSPTELNETVERLFIRPAKYIK